MAVIESPEAVGVRPFHEFDEANATWPRGDRLEAIRTASEEFRSRFKGQGRVRGVGTADLVSAAYPTRYAFGGAARGNPNPYLNLLNRLVLVQFEDFQGQLKTLCWQPTVPDGSSEAPFYSHLIDRFGERLVLSTEYHSLAEAIALFGLTPEDIDFVSFDHLHAQDLRILMGTSRPVEGEREPRRPFFANAKFLLQRKEVDTFCSPHPMQWAWYVPRGMEHLLEDNLVLIDGDAELGVGVALTSTPGHTDGTQSLVLNTPDGVWVTSENGVAADNWHPHLSKIPGLRREAESMGREVILNSATLEDSIDQYDSMVKEKALADPNRADPRWMNVFPSAELSARRRQWPIVPSFTYGGISYGTIEPPSRG
ncbi:MAG: hypothetical protein H0U25_08445 [Thermoleophilaceae bacterium]|nr:hypothetical protein [Thermoleophilaceae bacterium]